MNIKEQHMEVLGTSLIGSIIQTAIFAALVSSFGQEYGQYPLGIPRDLLNQDEFRSIVSAIYSIGYLHLE